MIMPTTDANAPTPWTYAAVTIVAALGGAVLKTFTDLVGRRDSSAEKWRADLMAESARLRVWCTTQQEELSALRGRIDKMQESVVTEQTMRHDLKNQLVAEKMAHELLKAEHVHLSKEHESLKVKYAELSGVPKIQT